MKLIYIMCVIFLLKEVERRCVLLLLTRKPLSLLCHPLQYTTDDLDYTSFDEYSEGTTETSPTYDDFEPQVNRKSEGQDVFVSFRFWFFRVLSPCPTVMFTFMSKLKRSTCPATLKYRDHALSVQYCRCKFERGCKHTQCASPVLSVYSLLLECHLL